MSSDHWKRAASFAELCELGARFVESRVRSFPGWGAPLLDAESIPLIPRLARLNRAGLLTLASQPARSADWGVAATGAAGIRCGVARNACGRSSNASGADRREQPVAGVAGDPARARRARGAVRALRRRGTRALVRHIEPLLRA